MNKFKYINVFLYKKNYKYKYFYRSFDILLFNLINNTNNNIKGNKILFQLFDSKKLSVLFCFIYNIIFVLFWSFHWFLAVGWYRKREYILDGN